MRVTELEFELVEFMSESELVGSEHILTVYGKDILYEKESLAWYMHIYKNLRSTTSQPIWAQLLYN